MTEIRPISRETIAAYRQGYNDAIQRAYAEIRTVEIARHENLGEILARVIALMQNDRD